MTPHEEVASDTDQPGISLTQLVYCRFCHDLLDLLPGSAVEIGAETRLENVVPWHVRRRVWRELSVRGHRLPDLELPAAVVGLSFASALGRSALLAWLFNSPIFGLAIFPFAFLSWLMSRPLAVRTPDGCQTVREAVLQATPFRREDYQAGLWPRSDISAKVRLLFAEIAGVPFESVTEDTPLAELFP